LTLDVCKYVKIKRDGVFTTDRNNEHWQSLALFLAAVIVGRVKKDKGEKSIVNGKMTSRHKNVISQDSRPLLPAEAVSVCGIIYRGFFI
jgi:hypothetical protein